MSTFSQDISLHMKNLSIRSNSMTDIASNKDIGGDTFLVEAYAQGCQSRGGLVG